MTERADRRGAEAWGRQAWGRQAWGRQAWGRQAGGAVLASEFSKEVDGGRMETIGKLEILLGFALT